MTRPTPFHGAPEESVDLSGSSSRRASEVVGRGLPARITEADLLLSNTPRRLRVEDCACGGTVAATDGDWDDIRVAIEAHAAGSRHHLWRAERLA